MASEGSRTASSRGRLRDGNAASGGQPSGAAAAVAGGSTGCSKASRRARRADHRGGVPAVVRPDARRRGAARRPRTASRGRADSRSRAGSARGIQTPLQGARLEPVARASCAEPINELRDRIAEEVRRRESPDALVPIDRDPVPPQFAEGVRRYYERLGSGR